MNAEWKAKWVAALRSGKYQQCRGKLHADLGFCCLGVLCDIYNSDLWSFERRSGEQYGETIFMWGPFYDESTLPPIVVKGVGLNEVNPRIYCSGSISTGTALSALNDNGYTFEEIADAIERDPSL